MKAMRSFLLAPISQVDRLEAALSSPADVVILDAQGARLTKDGACWRQCVQSVARTPHTTQNRLMVRINALKTDQATDQINVDIQLALSVGAFGLALPQCRGGADVAWLDAKLKVWEALTGHARPPLTIIAQATDQAQAVQHIHSYHDQSPRLYGLIWDCPQELARPQPPGRDVLQFIRSSCLVSALGSGVLAIDRPYEGDKGGLKAECRQAAQDGFSGKLTRHIAHVAVINACFGEGAS